MPAYIIARVNVTDPRQYAKYVQAVPAVIAQFGGRALARGESVVTLEGEEEAGRVVILEFPNATAACAFYQSPEYQQVKKLREHAATGQLILIDGVG